MTNKPCIHEHTAKRLRERFDADRSWLQEELESGRYVWLKGLGRGRDGEKVRSGHLLYLSHNDEYCVAVVDNRKRLVITVLTEEMALKSSWGMGIDATTKLKAKRLSLGSQKVDDSTFLRLIAETRNGLLVYVRARTYSYEWVPTIFNINKLTVTADQMDTKTNRCTLSNGQAAAVSSALNELITTKKIQPYCDFWISTSKGKNMLISNIIEGVSALEAAESARRWVI
jgi:hypothetical protein